MPSVACPNCARTLKVPESAVGKSGRCPSCKHPFTVPAAAEEPAAGYGLAEPAATSPAPAAPKRKKKKKRTREQAAPPLWPILAGSAVVVGLLVAGLVWLFSGDGGGKVGGGGGGGTSAQVAEAGLGDGEENPTREPKPLADAFDLAAVPAADPAGWKVTADPLAAPPGKVRSAVSIPYLDPAGPEAQQVAIQGKMLSGYARTEAILFAPAANTAAVLTSMRPFRKPGTSSTDVPGVAPARTLELFAYDLGGDADPVGRTVLSPNWRLAAPTPTPFPNTDDLAPCALPADISPDGKRVAVRMDVAPDQVILGGVGQAGEERYGASGSVEWLGLPSADVLLTLAAGRLWRHQGGPAGRTEPELKLTAPAVFTPGRAFVGAMSGRSLVWFRTDTLKPVGTLPLPPGDAADKATPAVLAVSPDGKSLALVEGYGAGQTAVLVYDLTTGKPTAGHRLPRRLLAGVGSSLWWDGPRRLVVGGSHVVDLDLGVVVGRYEWDVPGVRVAATSPDGRLWHTGYYLPPPPKRDGKVRDPKDVKWPPDPFADKLGELPGVRDRAALLLNRLVLAAAPTERLAAVSADGQPLVFRPGLSVRVVGAAEEADAAWGRRAAARVADVLAEAGYRVDPAAPLTVKATVRKPETGSDRQFVVDRAGPAVDYGRLVDQVIRAVTLDCEVTDPAGRAVARFRSVSTTLPLPGTQAKEGQPVLARNVSDDGLRAEALERLRTDMLPRRTVTGADGQPLKLPLTLPLGIDGLLARPTRTPDGR